MNSNGAEFEIQKIPILHGNVYVSVSSLETVEGESWVRRKFVLIREEENLKVHAVIPFDQIDSLIQQLIEAKR